MGLSPEQIATISQGNNNSALMRNTTARTLTDALRLKEQRRSALSGENLEARRLTEVERHNPVAEQLERDKLNESIRGNNLSGYINIIKTNLETRKLDQAEVQIKAMYDKNQIEAFKAMMPNFTAKAGADGVYHLVDSKSNQTFRTSVPVPKKDMYGRGSMPEDVKAKNLKQVLEAEKVLYNYAPGKEDEYDPVTVRAALNTINTLGKNPYIMIPTPAVEGVEPPWWAPWRDGTPGAPEGFSKITIPEMPVVIENGEYKIKPGAEARKLLSDDIAKMAESVNMTPIEFIKFLKDNNIVK